jgi:3-oxoacyl-[acyl-carrier-protein] synthase-1
MKQANQIAVTGLGAIAPVGSHVDQTCASIRAGINRFQAHPYYTPRLPEPPLSEPQLAMVSPVSPFDPGALLPERLMQLALAPMNDLIKGGKLRRDDFKSAAVLVSLPAVDRTRHLSGYEKAFIGEYFKRLAIEPGPIQQLFQEGHTGVFSAVEEASRLLRSGACRFCIVLGVDSYLDKESLDRLDEAYRLKSERNVDGFIPGESAALVLLETLEHATARKASVLAKIAGLGRGVEKENLASEKASSGRGLADALAQLNGEEKGRSAAWVICDLNGESGRSREWGMVLCRSAASFGQLKKLSHPADCAGDVGAASGALFIAIACRAFARGYAPASEALLWTSSDSGQRAACRIEKAN